MKQYSTDILPHGDSFAVTKSGTNIKYNMYDSHYHNHYEILYILEGRRTLIINNTKTYSLSENSIALIPPGCVHRTVSDCDEIQTKILVAISKELMNKICAFTTYVSSILGSVYVPLLNEQKNKIHSLLEKIVKTKNTYLEDEYQKLFTAELMVELYKCIESQKLFEKPTTSNQFVSKRMNEVAAYIQNNWTKKITLESIAKHFHIQKTYLARCFKNHLGLTVTSYINTIRIIKAQEILKSTDVSIETTAYSSGFESRIYFERVFKKITGQTPNEYRKNIKKAVAK